MSGTNVQTTQISQMNSEKNCITLLARDPNWLYVYWDLTFMQTPDRYSALLLL